MTATANQNICSACEQAIRHGIGRLDAVPGLIKRIITEQLWRERKIGSEVVRVESFRELITAKPLTGWGESPEKIEAIIRDDPETLAMWHKEMELKPGPKTDSSHDNIMRIKQGTSRAYTVSRLSKERPDLFDKVKAGELSANAAAIEAGWRKKKTALEQARFWIAKLSPDELQTLLREIRA